jgi:Ca2+-transporting ATPase
MATLHELKAGNAPLASRLRALCGGGGAQEAVVFVKGAVDSLLEACNLDEGQRTAWLARNDELAAQGIRVLGLACRAADRHTPVHELEQGLRFLGMAGMVDPLREDVPAAVKTVMAAGIRPVMITGDHPLMAQSIGRELGVLDGERPVLTGRDLSGLESEALADAAEGTSVFARVSPEQKLRLVDALQARGQIVSMTGDGVNDAPALKSADIGVAMGVTGTDVAKEASDMVLLDDRYTTIVKAVREGRVIFDNIRRFVRFILASNAGELLVMLIGPFLGLPLPLLPVQILWMNLVTDGLPALALGVEKAERDVMKRTPRRPDAPIIDWAMGAHILWVGLLMAGLSLWVGLSAWDGVGGSTDPHGAAEAATWQTMLFSTMVFVQLFLALAVRSTTESLFRIGIFSNRPMILALAATCVLQLGVIYLPLFQGFFHTVALTGRQLGFCAGAAALVFVAVEAEKMVGRMRKRGSG